MNIRTSPIVATGSARRAAEVLVATGIRRTAADSLWDESAVDLVGAVSDVLAPFLGNGSDALGQLQSAGTGRESWLALDGERAAAMLSLTLRRVEPGDPEYAYMPPRYAALGMAGTLVDRRSDLQTLEALYRHASTTIDAAGINEVTVQIRTGDWINGSFWRGLEFRPDGVLAARRSTPMLQSSGDLVVREAVSDDTKALVRMSRQEQDFQPYTPRPEPLRDSRFKPRDRPSAPGFQRHRRRRKSWKVLTPEFVLGCAALMVLSAPVDTARASYLPATHGYIELVNVDETARGRGIGRARTAGALRWFADHGSKP